MLQQFAQNKKKLLFRIFLPFIFLSVATSCSTKKNTFTSRTFHNITAHYNPFWNGRESYREGVRTLAKTRQDNYTSILSVYNFGTKEEALSLNPNMDRAIEKSSITIRKHSMKFRDKEYVRWIDNSYLLVGKSNFYKQEYLSANRAFDYVINNFETKTVYEAMVWKALTDIQTKNYESAEAVLEIVNAVINSSNVNHRTKKSLPLVYSHLYLKQEQYAQAADHLIKSLPYITKKSVKTRCLYIIGQIKQLQEDYKEASIYYKKVIKRNPDYELAFNARMNLAKSYAGSGNSKQIEKELFKMLKDKKNQDYKDQIYYTLSDISLKKNNDKQAIEYLKKSVAIGYENRYQKSLSARTLADIYYKNANYINAQAYYDTTMQFIDKEHSDYEELEGRTDVLTDLVENISIVKEEDSLQILAKLSEKDQIKFADKMIAKHKAEQAKQKQQSRSRRGNNYTDRELNRQISKQGGSKWYFYNPSAVSYGYQEFMRRWGRRKLTDLWRLSNKTQVYFDDEEQANEEGVVDSANIVSTDPKKRETYLQYIPNTPEKIEVSNRRMSDAMYNIGIIYNEDLKEKELSAKSFENLVNRFPEDVNKLRSCFQLIDLYREIGNMKKAEFYKNLVLNNYSDSDYAKILIDPSYKKEVLAKINRISSLYEETYNAYNDGLDKLVVLYADEAISKYKNKKFLSKFEFLKAAAKGRLHNQDSLLIGMQNILKKYPGSEVEPLVQNILEHYIEESGDAEGKIAELEKIQEMQRLQRLYSFSKNAEHLYIIVANANNIDIKVTKTKLSDHNRKYFKISGYKINSLILENDRHIVSVGNFRNSRKAIDYLNSVENSKYVYSHVENTNDYQHFVISMENYSALYKDKDTDAYLKFFREMYLNKK